MRFYIHKSIDAIIDATCWTAVGITKLVSMLFFVVFGAVAFISAVGSLISLVDDASSVTDVFAFFGAAAMSGIVAYISLRISDALALE